MNSLQQSLEKLNNNLSNDFDKTKAVFEEAVTNHCSDHTKTQLFNKVQIEWSKHQKLARKELKSGLSSYCDIGLYNLKIQIAILEKLQVINTKILFIEELFPDRILSINYHMMEPMRTLVFQILLRIVYKHEKISIQCYVLCLIQPPMIHLLYLIQNDRNFLVIT
jgi:hypothetical protein